MAAPGRSRPPPTPNRGERRTARCFLYSSTICMATGKNGAKIFAERWNGTSWSIVTMPSPAEGPNPEDVSCTSASFCIAAGYYLNESFKAVPFAESWNGSAWSIQSVPKPSGVTDSTSLRGVSCTSSTACIAVGKYVNASKEERTLAESWNGSSWSVQTSTNLEGKKYDVLQSISCTNATACTAVGGAGPSGSWADETVTLAERWSEADTTPPDTTITGGPTGLTTDPNPQFSFEASEIHSTFECALDAGSYGSCTSPKPYEGLPDGSHVFKVRATDESGNQDKSPAERSFTVDRFPETTITSPTPSYTSHENWPVTFSSSDAGSTFKCGLDSPGGPTKTCTSPYTLPEHLASGWHTFEVKATDPAGSADPTPAVWKFNPGAYPPAPSTSKLLTPEDGKKTASYYTLKAEWGAPPKGGGVSSVSYQLKLPVWSAFKDIPTKYLLDSEGQQPGSTLAVGENPERRHLSSLTLSPMPKPSPGLP